MDALATIRYRIEAGAARGLIGALGMLPGPLGASLGRGVAQLWRALMPRRNDLAYSNLKAAFPEASEAQLQSWLNGCWDNLGTVLWEVARLAKMTPLDYREAIQVHGMDRLRASHLLGRGVLLFTAHFTNWEYATPFISLENYPLAVIARRIKNPFVDAWVTAIRARFGVTVISHREAVKESLKWLRKGHVLGMLFDQRITAGGVSVNFFGRPAPTTILPALLALKVQCPVHPVSLWRRKGQIHAVVEPAMDLSGLPSGEAGVLAATQRMSEVVEGWVRHRPDLWLWIHNRWKI